MPMTSPRQEFLSAMFRILGQKAICYCVLRNYQNIYEDASSDVDLLVAPADVPRTEDCLAEAAAASSPEAAITPIIVTPRPADFASSEG